MKLHGSEGMLLMEVTSITKNGRNINIKGKMMGQVPMTIVLGPSNLREAIKMLSASVIWQAIRMFFMRGEEPKK